MNKMDKITALELTVRTIDDMIPEMSTKALQKWQGILTTTLHKVEKELTSTCLHTCKICFQQEWGYRDELPPQWFRKGDSEICFQHSYSEAEKFLKENNEPTDAFLPPEVDEVSIENLEVSMNHLPAKEIDEELTLKELMEII